MCSSDADDGCLICVSSVLTTDVLFVQFGADDGCLIVCRSAHGCLIDM